MEVIQLMNEKDNENHIENKLSTIKSETHLGMKEEWVAKRRKYIKGGPKKYALDLTA